MDSKPPPQWPKKVNLDFLVTSMRYEYFKRNCTRQATENLQGMMDSSLARWVNEQLYPIPQEVKEPSKSPPVKKRRTNSPEKKEDVETDTEEEEEQPEPVQPAEGPMPDPDPDSDNSDFEESFVEEEEEVQPPAELKISRRGVKMFFGMWAANEIRAIREEPGPWFKFILKMLSIQSIASKTFSERKDLTIETIHVNIAYRKMLISLDHDKITTSSSLQYWSTDGGCLFWYKDTVRLIREVKYQKLAARHFFSLVRNLYQPPEWIRFTIDPFRSDIDPPIWPFRSFYRKVEHHLQSMKSPNCDWHLNVRRFIMDVQRDKGDPYAASAIVKSVLQFLTPGVLFGIKLRVWNDKEVFTKRGINKPNDSKLLVGLHLSCKEQWTQANHVDIVDNEIGVHNYQWLCGRMYVFVQLETRHFRNLLRGFADCFTSLRLGHAYNFYVNREFNVINAEAVLNGINFRLKREGKKISAVFAHELREDGLRTITFKLEKCEIKQTVNKSKKTRSDSPLCS